VLHINVNENTEKKNGLTYLSWAWAWAECLKADPQATWGVVTYGPAGDERPFMAVGKTAMVHTWVTIKGLRRECMLPVMDHRNKAIPDPDAFAVNTAIMRCMTKAISMHGLGLYIYAGEDLPQAEAPETPEQKSQREKMEARGAELDRLAEYLIELHQKGNDLQAINLWNDPQTWAVDVPEANEEKKYVWGLLQPYSKLRSAIKANKPA
jgi:hypothetical protein